MAEHERKCRDCGSVAMHEAAWTPFIECKMCGSTDTRRTSQHEVPSDAARLVELIEDMDRRLPPCSDNAFQMIAYATPEDLLQPIRDGRLVVISRGMLRAFRNAIASGNHHR